MLNFTRDLKSERVSLIKIIIIYYCIPTAAENIIILYRVIETGRKKKTTPNREVAAAEGGTRRISRRDQRMPLGGGRYTILYTHIIIMLSHSTRDDVVTHVHERVCAYCCAPEKNKRVAIAHRRITDGRVRPYMYVSVCERWEGGGKGPY